MMNSPAPNTLRRLILTSIIYIVVAAVAGVIAIARNLPAQPLGEGSGTGRPVLQEFLIGNGTGMSPGLPWLAAQAVLTFLAARRGRWGTVAVVGLALFGVLSGVFGITEPTFLRALGPATFDPLLAAVEVAMGIVAFAMTYFAVTEWLRRRRGA